MSNLNPAGIQQRVVRYLWPLFSFLKRGTSGPPCTLPPAPMPRNILRRNQWERIMVNSGGIKSDIMMIKVVPNKTLFISLKPNEYIPLTRSSYIDLEHETKAVRQNMFGNFRSLCSAAWLAPDYTGIGNLIPFVIIEASSWWLVEFPEYRRQVAVSVLLFLSENMQQEV